MPAVTRIGDADVTHCSGMVRAQGSSNVFVNGIGVSRQGDNNTTGTFVQCICFQFLNLMQLVSDFRIINCKSKWQRVW